MKLVVPMVAVGWALWVPLAAAQDAARGARIYTDTAAAIGKPVATCAACHADTRTLRELIRNRGGQPEDAPALARWLGAVFAGSQPGASSAKAQYRGMLTAADVHDLAAYIAEAKRAARQVPALAGTRVND